MDILITNNLAKDYHGFLAVNNLSFSIAQGEIFGFLGPNGAGKTSTINMLTGLARPTHGTISIAGVDGIKDIKKVQHMIGIVPDESNLYDDLSGFDNLAFCAALYGMDKTTRESRAHQLLHLFGLADTGKRPFKAFSKGMKRKLTIAAGIIHDPAILFLDEPTTGIDVETARQIRQLILNLNQNGTTIFLTTHYIEEAERLCSRIGFIVAGEIVKIGFTQDLLLEAQRDNTVQFTMESSPEHLYDSLAAAFPDYGFYVMDQHTVRISSPALINLMPFMQYFDSAGMLVREAKIIKPSLEDVFLKVTGVDAQKMKKEKEGGKK